MGAKMILFSLLPRYAPWFWSGSTQLGFSIFFLFFTTAARRATVVIMSRSLSLTESLCHCVCHVNSIVGLWLVENIIVIEVEVNELHEGKILSRASTSMTISAVAQENKKNNERLSWAVPHSEINQPKNCPRYCPGMHRQKRRHFHAKTTVYWRSTHGAEHIPHRASNTTFGVLVSLKSKDPVSPDLHKSNLILVILERGSPPLFYKPILRFLCIGKGWKELKIPQGRGESATGHFAL